MMNSDFALLAFGFMALAFLGALVGIVLGGAALAQLAGLRIVQRLTQEVEMLRGGRVAGRAPMAAPAAPPVAPTPAPVAAAPAPFAAAPASAATTPVVPPIAVPAVVPAGAGVPPRVAQFAAARQSGAPASSWQALDSARRDKNMDSLESKIGQRWIAWVGAIVVFFSVVFFLRYAFQNDWIGPTGQVIISALGGAVLAAAGSYFINKHWRIFGQCLMGLGLAILYASFYGAFQIYDPPVMGQNTAFGFLIAVTVAGMALAILHNALAMAFMAVLGGLLTPVLVSTGQDSRDVLFTYLLVLDLGVMAVAFFRNWRLLDTLALVGTFLYYTGWWAKFFTPEGLWPAMAWLGGIYLVFLILPFVYHLVRKQALTVERFLMAVANAAFAVGFAWYMMRKDHLDVMAFITLGVAGIYLLLGALLRRRVPTDQASLFGAVTMTVTFLTLAVPMKLQADGILLAWVAEAPVLAFLAYRFRYPPLRALAFMVLVVGVGRLLTAHWPLHSGLYELFANKQFLSAMTVPAAGAMYALAHHLFRKDQTDGDRTLKLFSALGSGLLALVIVHVEIRGWLSDAFDGYTAGSAVTALWTLGACLYVGSSLVARRAGPWLWGMAALTIAVATILGLANYSQHELKSHILLGNLRFVTCLAFIVAAAWLAWTMRRAPQSPAASESNVAIGVLVAALVGLLFLLSTEVYTYCRDLIEDRVYAARAGQMSITLVWSLYAAGLLWVGFWKRWRWVRWGGLALFGLAAVKLAVADLGFLKDFHRIISFFVLGLLMLAASYLYHRLEKRLGAAPAKEEPAPAPAGESI